ncbi:ABC transporter permease [Nakamurella deserti]|uniref:ABC transporter permease n=1 Tax=Nakamurella deserti TaxID=2164074 RepID=UPI000DBEAA98|nr:ABC transporter permease [Nakamurella deserti]
MIGGVLDFLTRASNWSGPQGIPARIGEHLYYSAIAIVIALVIALPLGLLIGHTGRGVAAVSLVVNAVRSLPSFGLLIFFVVLLSPLITGRNNLVYLLPTEVVLVLLALPSILGNTVAGIQNADAAARDAARGMGMTSSQVLFRVELPNALPLIISGVRSAALQVIATATIASYVSLGGLGRYVFTGLAQQDYSQMAAGAVLVAVLALVVDLLLALVQRLIVSPGVSGRFRSRVEPGPATAAVVPKEPAVA